MNKKKLEPLQRSNTIAFASQACIFVSVIRRFDLANLKTIYDKDKDNENDNYVASGCEYCLLDRHLQMHNLDSSGEKVAYLRTILPFRCLDLKKCPAEDHGDEDEEKNVLAAGMT